MSGKIIIFAEVVIKTSAILSEAKDKALENRNCVVAKT
jgi:hypothetical protein